MKKNKDFFLGFLLDKVGGGTKLDKNSLDSLDLWANNTKGILWFNLDYNSKDAQLWLKKQSGLDEFIISALLAEDTRPRSSVMPQGLLVILCGVNINSDDIISIRLWLEQDRIISIQHKELGIIKNIANNIEYSVGPKTSMDFLILLAHKLNTKLSDVIDDLSLDLDSIEDILLEEPSTVKSRGKSSDVQILDLRHQAIQLKKFLYPQKTAWFNLKHNKHKFLTENIKKQINEILEQNVLFISEIEAIRDRLISIQEESANKITKKISRNLFILSVVAAMFLPLSVITGLLGMNVGGIPGAHTKWGFWLVCAFLVIFIVIMIFLFKKKKWWM